ncbi:Las1-domain-containing protein [Xylariaceae sp. FL1019]|nr:Las1-domain-containing protein [Xylariaceae sp. FL1019]
MVQYIHTPWRDRDELLRVRQQFYPQAASTAKTCIANAPFAADGSPDAQAVEAEEQQRQAVTHVSMWMHRGDCPHLIEATAFLTDALLGDLHETRTRDYSNFLSVRLSYAAAFSRFVTGLLDSQQDKFRKQGMYTIAKNIGLPATFVELRHRATHEPLPSLKNLRSGAQNALAWIYDFYWKDLTTSSGTDEVENDLASSPRITTMIKYLTEQDRAARQDLQERWKSWDKDTLMLTLQDIAHSAEDSTLQLKALQLLGVILEGTPAVSPKTRAAAIRDSGTRGSIDAIRAELQTMKSELDQIDTRITDSDDVANALPEDPPAQASGWTAGTGSSDNYAYLVVDDKSKDAVIVDPAHPEEVAPVLKEAIQAGKINLKAIVNTHHHWDHSGGNKKLLGELSKPDLPIIGGEKCEAVTKTPGNGEEWSIGSIAVKGVYTPCHTQDSICWFMQDGDDKVVFTGDTLFHGGCGRFFEGTADEMHIALNKTLAALPDDTKVYPGHEYTKANVKFGVSVLQNAAIQKLQSFADSNKETQGKFTIGDERQHNVFMRVDDPEIQKATGKTEPVEVMAALREMKNNFKEQNVNKVDNECTTSYSAKRTSGLREAVHLRFVSSQF